MQGRKYGAGQTKGDGESRSVGYIVRFEIIDKSVLGNQSHRHKISLGTLLTYFIVILGT